MKRSKRPPRGNGNRLGPPLPCHQHPLFSPFGEYWYDGHPCQVIEFHPHKDGRIKRKARAGEQFTIRQNGRLKIVDRKLVLKQAHSPRSKAPFTKRRRLGT
jgi:hypothetical protein